MNIERHRLMSFAAASLLTAVCCIQTSAQPATSIAAGRTVLTFVNRLVINPPQVQVFGYFVTIEGLPSNLFSGTPGEGTAYLTWSLDAAGATQLTNGDRPNPRRRGPRASRCCRRDTR